MKEKTDKAGSHAGLYRVLDAAANRAGEGLRVMDDFARFVLDDLHLTARCKALRHELTADLDLTAGATFSEYHRYFQVGDSFVDYLQNALNIRFFVDLWDIRTEL